jgi:hypothetical protein
MKNKLRAIANWIMVVTMPIWFPFTIFGMFVYDMFFEKNENVRKHNLKKFKAVFIKGEDWFWE